MQVHPATTSRVVLLECGARPTDLGWYTHPAAWPAAAAEEGDGDLWACVAADGRLRVFEGRTASSRTLLHSTPVLGPVLALALWPARQVAITLEEATEPRARYSRIIRFYSWSSREREVLELSAVELDQPPQSAIFSPSLFSLCTHSRTLALAEAHKIKLYHLDDIFADPATHQPVAEDPAVGEAEPGAELRSSPVAAARPALASPSRAIAATFPHTRRYTVKVYQVLPTVTVFSPFAVRHLDYKQSFLSYGSFNECRLVCLRLEQTRPGQAGLLERQALGVERARAEAALPSTRSLMPKPPQPPPPPPVPPSPAHKSSKKHPSSRAPSVTNVAPPPPPPPPPAEAYELIGRSVDHELRLAPRDDMCVREVVVLLHRFNPTQQIHTIRLLPPLKQRTGRRIPRAASLHPSAVGAVAPNSLPPHSISPPPLPASFCAHPLTAKQELFGLLDQGLPAHPFSVPLSLDASPSNPSFASSFEHGGVVVELLDDEAEASSTREQLQMLLARLEELEDESEERETKHRRRTSAQQAGLANEEGASEATPVWPAVVDATSDSSPPAIARSNGSIYLPMRFMVSSSEECHLYDVESDRRLATYNFDHDLVSLQVRSSFVLALTTHGLEVHSLWYAHPMQQYLLVPLRVSSEALKEKAQDMLVLDHHILFRPSPVSQPQGSAAFSDMFAGSPPPQLIVPTEEVDPCESWATMPLLPMPSVLGVVAHSIQPLAIKSMKSSKEATPSAIRLFTEALLLLIQRYSQLSVLVERSTSAASVSLEREFAGVAATLSSVNSYLAHLFLSSQELGLSCYFFYYQHDATLDTLWAQLTSGASTTAGAPTSPSSSSSHTRYVTKLLLKVLLRPTAAEQSLLLSSPALIASFVSYLGAHSPHVLGSVLLKTFLLHCPYDPKQLLAILDGNTTRANYEASVAGSSSASYQISRGASVTDTPTSATSPGAHTRTLASTSYRVRPVVFHTFVQALLHLQLSGKDAASILLHSFSGQSLEYLLVTYSSLLTTWSHRHLLVDLLRASVPWSLLEALVVLTQRGEMHVHEGVALLLGPQAAASVLAPTLSAAAPPQASFSSSISITQLQAYLECSLSPYLLSQESGDMLEHEHAASIEPFESPADVDAYMATAAASAAAAKPEDVDDVTNPHGKFVPLHARQQSRSPLSSDASSLTRSQVADLATQLACFYIQHELLEGSLSNPRPLPAGPTSPAPRRTASHSMSMALAPGAEFALKHPLSSWWRAPWLDRLRGHVADATPEAIRMRRLQALLSTPLPLARRHCQQIHALVVQMPPDQPGASPFKASLLMLLLPRVGDLSSALRLVVGHSPECMWPFAAIYCGGQQVRTSIRTPLQANGTVLRHWQLLHAVLLLHVFHSAHSGAILRQHAPPHVTHPADATDDAAARALIQPLIPLHLVDQVLRPSPLVATTPAGLTPVECAALYQQLYVFLFNQLVARHTPTELLAFIPQAGSSNFYLPFVEASFAAADRAVRTSTL